VLWAGWATRDAGDEKLPARQTQKCNQHTMQQKRETKKEVNHHQFQGQERHRGLTGILMVPARGKPSNRVKTPFRIREWIDRRSAHSSRPFPAPPFQGDGYPTTPCRPSFFPVTNFLYQSMNQRSEYDEIQLNPIVGLLNEPG
jgi:hypothetical protein